LEIKSLRNKRKLKDFFTHILFVKKNLKDRALKGNFELLLIGGKSGVKKVVDIGGNPLSPNTQKNKAKILKQYNYIQSDKMKDMNNQNNLQKRPSGSSLPVAYCQACYQVRVCKRLDSEKCCSCVIENKTEQWQDYQTYRRSLDFEIQWKKEHEEELRKLAKGETAEDWFRFNEWRKFYRQKAWGVNLEQWLIIDRVLPIDIQCAQLWHSDPEHLSNSCDCLKRKAKENFFYFSQRWREMKKELRKCRCVRSEKFRVEDDYYAWCDICETGIKAASKKRVVKNRNDPRFWGLEVSEKILCGDCLVRFRVKMPRKKRKEFNRYLKRGMFS
jgi:hypothetical protein